MSEQQEESCVVCESKGHRTTEFLIQVMLESHFQTK